MGSANFYSAAGTLCLQSTIGQPTAVIDIILLDWALRKDLLAVFLAFGQDDFFYEAIQQPLEAAGLWDWFLEAYQPLKDEL
jgi:hypothetical protein